MLESCGKKTAELGLSNSAASSDTVGAANRRDLSGCDLYEQVRWLLLQQCLNLPNQYGKIGTSKTHFRGRDAIVFDIGRNVLVMRMGTLQLWYIWVGHRVIPPGRFTLIGEFIEIPEDAMSDEINLLKHTQHMPRAKHNIPPRDSYGLAGCVYCYSVTLDGSTSSQQREDQPGIVTISVQSV